MNIGVIGGADGPTAIFVTLAVNWIFVAIAGFALLAAIVLLVVLKKKKRR